MYSAGKWDWSFPHDGTHDYGAKARGYARRGLVGSATGAVHTDLGLCRLSSGGQVHRHVHSFEQCAYILGGEPEVELGAERFQLCTGDYVLFPVGSARCVAEPGGPRGTLAGAEHPATRGRPTAGGRTPTSSPRSTPPGHPGAPTSGTRPSATSAITSGRRPSKRPWVCQRRAGPRARRHGHGPSRLQRDLDQDARGFQPWRRAAHDVHRRL